MNSLKYRIQRSKTGVLIISTTFSVNKGNFDKNGKALK